MGGMRSATVLVCASTVVKVTFRNKASEIMIGNPATRTAQSQRDCVLQPRVARNKLPWERNANPTNPNGVAAKNFLRPASPEWTQPRRGCGCFLDVVPG